ncbi:Uncharacterized protein TCM_036128 [Theobroma cacao]|uniref:RNase H type-1 domain-containing protein n=1 Tax=Theobroma cacao TaxID=3641 RepID=A0A061FJA9_THECC|nr:Uncharacterized protein TCM_036128 [Theobroma cacao]
MGCVMNAKVSVLVNGVATNPFKMGRGLRQGCSLSLFPFYMVAEAFSLLMDKRLELGACKRISIGSNRLQISHLQFTNDTMIFCKQEVRGLINTKRILRCFQAMSGLKINFCKSSLIGVGTNEQVTKEGAERIACMDDSNVQLVVGDGNRILFWEDKWMKRQPLKVRFPRIYALAINKEGYIRDYEIEEYHMSRKLEDTLAWKRRLSRQYAAGSFCKLNSTRRMLHGKVAIKYKLLRRRLLNQEIAGCVLFCWVVPGRLKEFFEIWNNIALREGASWDGNQVWENSTLRVTVWAKAKWPYKYGSTIIRYQNPSLGDERQPWRVWNRSVMRDKHGQIKIMFSKSIEVVDANLAEIIAIREAFILFIASKWGKTKSLIIKSDSSNAIKCVNQSTKWPWRLQKWILHIERLKRDVISWQVNHTFRDNNQSTDKLAKARIQCVQDLINVLD